VAQKSPTKRPDPGVAIGHVFLGKYRVEEILGVGGMGVVTKCLHMQLGELVAIKMLRKDVLEDRDAVERFMREAQAAARLRSEYVARVIDVGRFENNVPYMIMEFLDGHDLGALLDERGTLPVPWAAEMVMQTAEALAEAHSIGIVHRDVKPTNLFVTWRPDGSALVKVLDFGIARAPLGNDLKLTQTQSLLGTPAYMSPEQMRSARLVDARSDIWSLGTVMYELIEGRRPFEAESFSEMCVKVAVDAPAPMVNAPPALQEVVMRCLAKSPEQRYANMAEFGHALCPFMRDPKTASILVERMHRMIERGNQIDWAAGTPVPGVAQIPAAAETPAAAQAPAPAEAPAASLPPLAADPLAAEAAASAPPVGSISDELPIPAQILQAPRARRHAPSRAADDMTLKGPPRRKSGLLRLGMAALLGIAIGLVVFAISHSLEGSPEPRLAEPKYPAGQPDRPAAPEIPRSAAGGVVITPPSTLKPAPLAPPPPAASPVPPVPSVPSVIDRRPPIRQLPKATVKPPPPKPATTPAQECNPANHAHGCPPKT
jgi:hypothetical protein